MCKSHNPHKVDGCMRNIIELLKGYNVPTLACCCGHGRYPMTIVIRCNDDDALEIFSGKMILRKSRFYLKDKKGYYYIPETSKVKK